MAAEKVGLYHVTAQLATPLAMPRGLNLDGICTAALSWPSDDPVTRQTAELPRLPIIPISCLHYDDKLVYLSSDALFPSQARYDKVNWTKRRDGRDVDRLHRPFNRGGGPDRDAVKRGRVVITSSVGWVCWTRHPRWLLRVLSDRIDALGSLRGQGYGRVSGWEVAPVAGGTPDMAWIGEDRTLRALPVGWLRDEIMPTQLPVRPPYWHQETLTLAAPVGSHAPSGLRQDVMQKLHSDKLMRRALQQGRASRAANKAKRTAEREFNRQQSDAASDPFSALDEINAEMTELVDGVVSESQANEDA